jgi:hypothetical protein
MFSLQETIANYCSTFALYPVLTANAALVDAAGAHACAIACMPEGPSDDG